MMDKSDPKFSPLIIENSPIEFLVVGSHNGRDKVILRTTNASLDLVGLAAESQEEPVSSQGQRA